MFPRLEYDLPILSFDMVGKGGGPISLAVIDLCPVALNRSLPPQYYATVRLASCRLLIDLHAGSICYNGAAGPRHGASTETVPATPLLLVQPQPH
jgi:Ferredoxin-dependent bilin reductase